MRTPTLLVLPALALLLSAASTPAFGQPPAGGKPEAAPKPPPDESRMIIKEIEEAYKAPLEVDEDVRDELRKQYKNPTPEREAKLFYEIRRLYQTDASSEQAILREVRRAYELKTPEQEERVFAEIRRNEKLPLGMVHPSTQVEVAGKMFRRLDRDSNGALGPDELTDVLRRQRGQWDQNGDGAIDSGEYWAFYKSHHQAIVVAVDSGEIPLRLPKGVQGPGDPVPPAVEKNAAAARAGKLPKGIPAWFAEYDTDGDGMVGLYEWRRKGRPIAEFVPMDRNDDCYLTTRELLTFLAEQAAREKAEQASPPGGKPASNGKK